MSNYRRSDPSLPDAPPNLPNANATKSEVIGIAIAATVVVVLLLVVGAVCFLRRRRSRKSGRGRDGDTDSMDGDGASLHTTASKTPLMGQHSLSRAIESQASQYDDLAPPSLQRNGSTSTLGSLPPAYASINHSSQDPNPQDTDAPSASTSHSHQPASSVGGSDGLRPLMSIETQSSRDESSIGRMDSHTDQSLSSGSLDTPRTQDTPALHTPVSTSRPRATSRFREEPLDL